MNEPRRDPVAYRPPVPPSGGSWADPVPPDQRPALEQRARRAKTLGAVLPLLVLAPVLLLIGATVFAVSQRSASSGGSFLGLIFMVLSALMLLMLVFRLVRRR